MGSISIPILGYKYISRIDLADLADIMSLIENVPEVHSVEWCHYYETLRYLLGYDISNPNYGSEYEYKIIDAVNLWKEKAHESN
jgi:hypothetical protein